MKRLEIGQEKKIGKIVFKKNWKIIVAKKYKRGKSMLGKFCKENF